MLYTQEVIDICKNSLHPLTCKTIAKKIGVSRKVTLASIYHVQKFIDPNIKSIIPDLINNTNKHVVWYYNKQTI